MYGAGARYLLAMKLVSLRPIDRADLPVLLDESGITSKAELLDLVQAAYPHGSIPAAVQYVIDDLLEQQLRDRDPRGHDEASGSGFEMGL